MLTCPVCSRAFSWKEDLLHHFGAVHHLEELGDHLESEFTSETCPPCCRVPRTLFKKFFEEQAASSNPSFLRGIDTAQCMQENQLSTTECSRRDLPVHKMPQSDGTETNEDGGTKKLVKNSSPRRKRSDICVKSIERYHCDLCEFSANDIRQLEEHSSEHESQSTPVPTTPDGPVAAVIQETCDDDSITSPNKQVQEKYFCDFCPFSAKSQYNIAKHMKGHERSALMTDGYKCAYCNMASINSGAIKKHQAACHHDQPIKILHIEGGKVVEGPDNNCDSVSKIVKPKSSPSSCVSKKQRKSKLSKAKSIDVGSNSCASQKTVTNKQAMSALSLSSQEMLNSEKEGSTEALESKLPEQMIYAKPVCCPLCDFNNRIRLNLVKHIRLTHGNHQQSQTRPLKSCPSSVPATNSDKLTSLLQV